MPGLFNVENALAAIAVCQGLNIPERCIYVGDSEVDVITAGNAGAPCLSVLWGFRDEDCIRANGGKHFCHDPKDLPAMLRELAATL